MAGEERLTSAKGKLVLLLADGTTLDIPLDRERVTVGRRPGNDVCLPYAAVSAAHAVFVTTPTAVVVEDLGSTNGTMINGKRMSRQVVRDGDRVEIGRQQIVYLADVNAALPSSNHGDRPGSGKVLARTRSGGAAAAGFDSAPHLATSTAVQTFAGPWLKVLTGPGAGRMLPLITDEALVGRAGVQVAAVRRADSKYRLFLVEGAVAPRVDGAPVPAGGALLQPDSAIEVAGAQLAFLKYGDPGANSETELTQESPML